jgi:protein SCO1
VSAGRIALRIAIAVMLVALVVLAILNGARSRSPGGSTGSGELPVLGRVPALDLVRADGARVTNADLAGMPWVADFVFTRCVTSCPMLTSRLRAVGGGLTEGEDFRRVSISVDPAYDTPEVLREYGERRKIPESWWWLTGEPARVEELVRKGFFLTLEPNPGSPNDPILHSTRLVLIDAEGRIRGYYDGFDAEDLKKLDRDLARLAE